MGETRDGHRWTRLGAGETAVLVTLEESSEKAGVEKKNRKSKGIVLASASVDTVWLGVVVVRNTGAGDVHRHCLSIG